MKVEIYQAKWDWEKEKLVAVNAGYIDMDEFNVVKCWNICNWGTWKEAKPENLHSEIFVCTVGLAFYNPETKVYYVPKVLGHIEVASLEDFIKECQEDTITEDIIKYTDNWKKLTLEEDKYDDIVDRIWSIIQEETSNNRSTSSSCEAMYMDI